MGHQLVDWLVFNALTDQCESKLVVRPQIIITKHELLRQISGRSVI